MKTLLLPTDFSSAGESAMNYAINLAKKINAKLILFNTYPVPVYITDVPAEVTVNEEIKTEAELSLKRLEQRIKSTEPGLETESISAWGFASDEIIFQAKEKKADYIIMGTHGAGGLKKLLLGTNTADVVNKAESAVFAIPDNYIYKEPRKIVFATNCADEELPAIRAIAQLANTFNASLSLLHIADGILNNKMENSVLEAFAEKIKGSLGFATLNTVMIESPDMVQGLNDFIVNENIDLLAIGHHKRSYLSHLMRPSISKKIAYHLPSPLLVVPIEVKG